MAHFTWAQEVSSDELIEFQISQRDAGAALNEVAKQARVQMLFDYKIVQHIQTNEVIGSYSTWDALLLLVDDTGLQPVRIDDNIYSVVPGNNNTRRTEDMINNKNLLGSALVALAVAAPPIVKAQEGTARALEEIVVTSQKREQSLLDVPITVNALSGDDLDNFAVDNLFEAANLVPGLVFSRAPDDGLALTIRGLGTPARTQSFDQSVALFLDGIFYSKGRMYSSAFFDLERIEVVKGTQSTLLGKNTSLGAISLVTKKPGQEFAGNINASAEIENGGFSLDGGVDIPVSEKLNLRLAGKFSDNDGWVENILTGEDVPADEELGFRATAQYYVSDALTATLMYQYSDSKRTGNGFQFVDNGDFLPQVALDFVGETQLNDVKSAICPECPGGESFHDTTVDSAALTLEYALENHDITSVTSVADYEISFFDDFDFGNTFDEVAFAIFNPGTIAPYSTYFERDEEFSQFSQEIRIASSTGNKVDYLAGLFYFDSDWKSSEQQNFGTPNFPPPAPNQIFFGSFTNDFTQATETFSAFGSATVNFSDRFSGTLGLRYTDEIKDITFDRVQGPVATLWNTVINPPFESDLEFDDSFLNGNLNIQFDVTDNTMLYASYGLGNKTGGFAESAEVGSANPALSVADAGARVETEETRTYEIGAKMTLGGGVANLNIAAFRTEVEDFQETSFQVTDDAAFFLTRNIDAESEGIEIDGQWQASDNIRFSGGVTYADSINAGDGTDLAQAPKLTGSLGLIYEKELGSNLLLDIKVFGRYRDEMFSQINETFPSDSLTTYDMTIGLISLDDVWSLSLIGTNLTDEVSADFSGPPAAPVGAIFGAAPGDTGITAESPSALRSITIQAGYNF
ncbi:MAG: TonB-dependent receptor [Acidiferrobacterales bacterium]|nr:TonB-dependent receptor [Acidiferrobacterales bacterium]